MVVTCSPHLFTFSKSTFDILTPLITVTDIVTPLRLFFFPLSTIL
nr:MAG TPA: hypothetical protein [Caudoviricetes sp.]